MTTTTTNELERNIRKQLCDESGGDVNQEYISVIVALWYQCMASINMDFTMAGFDPCQGYNHAHQTCIDQFAEIFRTKRSLSKPEIHTCLARLARFYCSFPLRQEIDNADEFGLFEPHPKITGSVAITTLGLKVLSTITRAFWLRRKHLRSFVWESEAKGMPADDTLIKKTLEVALGRGDARATDVLLDEVRQRTIGRIMPPHGLYNTAAHASLAARDMYLVMREVDPDNLNEAHRKGSVPIILALEGEQTTQQEILVLLLLLAGCSLTLHDETFGSNVHPPTETNQVQIGFYCGEYIHILPGGTFRHGFGPGMMGAVGAVLPLLKDKDKLGYDYIIGTGVDFRPSLQEQEYEQAACFS